MLHLRADTSGLLNNKMMESYLSLFIYGNIFRADTAVMDTCNILAGQTIQQRSQKKLSLLPGQYIKILIQILLQRSLAYLNFDNSVGRFVLIKNFSAGGDAVGTAHIF